MLTGDAQRRMVSSICNSCRGVTSAPALGYHWKYVPESAKRRAASGEEDSDEPRMPSKRRKSSGEDAAPPTPAEAPDGDDIFIVDGPEDDDEGDQNEGDEPSEITLWRDRKALYKEKRAELNTNFKHACDKMKSFLHCASERAPSERRCSLLSREYEELNENAKTCERELATHEAWPVVANHVFDFMHCPEHSEATMRAEEVTKWALKESQRGKGVSAEVYVGATEHPLKRLKEHCNGRRNCLMVLVDRVKTIKKAAHQEKALTLFLNDFLKQHRLGVQPQPIFAGRGLKEGKPHYYVYVKVDLEHCNLRSAQTH